MSAPIVAFHMETSHLICCANQLTGFHIECNSGLKSVKLICLSAVVPLEVSYGSEGAN